MGRYVAGRGLPARGGGFLLVQLVLTPPNICFQFVVDAVVPCAADLALDEVGEEGHSPLYSPFYQVMLNSQF
jgi:hypothetical protein